MSNEKDIMEIKRQLYKRYLILAKESFEKAEPTKKMPKIGEQKKGYLISSIIFLALSIESFLNEFGYDSVESYDDLEKMNTLQKAIILPKICTNPQAIFKKSDHKFTLLKELFNYRNLFVHQKPRFRNENSSNVIVVPSGYSLATFCSNIFFASFSTA